MVLTDLIEFHPIKLTNIKIENNKRICYMFPVLFEAYQISPVNAEVNQAIEGVLSTNGVYAMYSIRYHIKTLATL